MKIKGKYDWRTLVIAVRYITGETLEELAIEHNVTPPTIGRWLKDAGVPRRRRGYAIGLKRTWRSGTRAGLVRLGNYLAAKSRDGKYHAVHRACWEAHYPLRKGFHVHHIDGNTTNNEMWNLAALAPGIHRTVHAEEARKALEAYRVQ